MKLPRTIRLDPSDTFVFARAAEAGEWAVPGSFRFFGVDPATLDGKARQSFRSGFLGLTSFGDSTLVVVTIVAPSEREAAVAALARHLVEVHGAPSEEVARAAAEEEIAFAASICEQPEGTIVALHRAYENGDLGERFRTLKPGARPSGDFTHGDFRAFTFHAIEGEEDTSDHGEIEDHVDLVTLGRRKQ